MVVVEVIFVTECSSRNITITLQSIRENISSRSSSKDKKSSSVVNVPFSYIYILTVVWCVCVCVCLAAWKSGGWKRFTVNEVTC